jgi:MFS family permease
MQWQVAVISAVVLGLVVGIPYYGLPFFYDYFELEFGWSRGSIVLGLPIGTLVTLVLGPLVVRKLPPRPCIVGGSIVCGLAIAGMGWMPGGLGWYFLLWILYMSGWIFAGPLSHQILLTQVFAQRRGRAMAVAYFGISLFGACSVALIARPLTEAFGFRLALVCLGAMVMLASPIAWLGLPRTVTQAMQSESTAPPEDWRSSNFWWLVIGSTLAVSGVGAVSQHLKLIFREAGYVEQARLDAVFGWTLMLMLSAGAIGRFSFAWGLDHLPKRRVIGVAFLLMAGAMPLLYFLGNPKVPYAFGLLYGLGMSADSLIVPLLAADVFGGRAVGRVMGWVMPINTVGQTWFPYVVTLLWVWCGSYTVPIAITFACILGGRMALAMLPDGQRSH